MNLMFWKKKSPGTSDQGDTDDDRTAAIPPETEPAEDSEKSTTRPGFLTRLRNTLSKLRKTSDAGSAEEGEVEDDRTVAIPRDAEPAEENQEGTVHPGFLTRLRNTLSTLRKPRDSGSGTSVPGSDNAGADDHLGDEEQAIAPVRNRKKRLIIGTALGAMILLLAAIGLTALKLFAPSKAEQHKPPATQASTAMQAQIEALKKQNAEMHSQLEALKKTEQGKTQAAVGTGGNPATTANEGVLVFTGKDTKASAEALKQAIDEMNAESDRGKPRKSKE